MLQRGLVGALGVAALFSLAACSGSGGDGSAVRRIVDPRVPASPAEGESRAGQSYAISMPSPVDAGALVAFEVFEPTTLTGGEKSPLVLEGHSLGGSRRTRREGLVATLTDAGYGVISIDQRGHGESGGDIRLIDPDAEGRTLLAILDWAEENLDWLAYAPDALARPNLVLGAVGASYGGAFQTVLAAIDPRQRLDAIVPQVTWYDLAESLLPSGAVKSQATTLLSAIGNRTSTGFDFDDPLLIDFRAAAAAGGQSSLLDDFLRYHGLGYFCEGVPVATNGGAGTAPGFLARTPAPVNALFIQGMRDTLFPLNQAYAAMRCLAASGGDVRLLTHQAGHNLIPSSAAAELPLDPAAAGRCAGLDATAATLAFFAEHLDGRSGAASAIPAAICLSLAAGDDVLVNDLRVGSAGTALPIPMSSIVSGASGAAAVVDLGFVVGAAGDVLAGIPEIQVVLADLLDAIPLVGDPLIFVGIGRQAAGSGGWDLVDDQLTPLRGAGTHVAALGGVAERLLPGDRLALLVFGAHPQFTPAGLELPARALVPVTISGVAFVPLLGPCGDAAAGAASCAAAG